MILPCWVLVSFNREFLPGAVTVSARAHEGVGVCVCVYVLAFVCVLLWNKYGKHLGFGLGLKDSSFNWILCLSQMLLLNPSRDLQRRTPTNPWRKLMQHKAHNERISKQEAKSQKAWCGYCTRDIVYQLAVSPTVQLAGGGHVWALFSDVFQRFSVL